MNVVFSVFRVESSAFIRAVALIQDIAEGYNVAFIQTADDFACGRFRIKLKCTNIAFGKRHFRSMCIGKSVEGCRDGFVGNQCCCAAFGNIRTLFLCHLHGRNAAQIQGIFDFIRKGVANQCNIKGCNQFLLFIRTGQLCNQRIAVLGFLDITKLCFGKTDIPFGKQIRICILIVGNVALHDFGQLRQRNRIFLHYSRRNL